MRSRRPEPGKFGRIGASKAAGGVSFLGSCRAKHKAEKIKSDIEARQCAQTLTLISAFSRPLAQSGLPNPKKEPPMKMLIDLFSTDYGLMSLAVIVLTLLMAAFFLRMFLHKMNHNE
jgi:hypothetical protein